MASVQLAPSTQTRGAAMDKYRGIVAYTSRPVAARDEVDTRTPSSDERLPSAEFAEDIVPYIPPLASYRVELAVGPARFGVPIIHPEDLYGGNE